MIEPAADAAVYVDVGVTIIRRPLKGKLHIRCVLVHGVTGNTLRTGNVAEGIEIAHGHIGRDAEPIKRGETAVDGDDEVEKTLVVACHEILFVEICGANQCAGCHDAPCFGSDMVEYHTASGPDDRAPP